LKKKSAIKEPIRKRTSNDAFSDLSFPNGLIEIHPYKIKVFTTENIEKKINIEVHRYRGFALIKFYPFHLKKNAKKYELRGEKSIGYSLSKKYILHIISECSLIMRAFLDNNPHEFVGYIGQIDSKDNERNREQSQRVSIYNTLTSSMFKNNSSYKILSNEVFKEINLRLIRKIVSNQTNKLTPTQQENYKHLLTELQGSPERLYDLMTNVTLKNLADSKQNQI
jgi:hypothetical protein